MNARQTAFELLQRCEGSKQYSNIAVDKALSASSLSGADKRLVSALVYGVIERRITLDYYISVLSSRPLEKIDSKTLCALRMGLYQLIFMDRIPSHAAVGETVELCPKSSRGFVNAILRGYTRLSEPIPLPRDSDEKYLSVAYSVCEPLAKKLITQFGRDTAEELLIASFDTPKTTLRVNTLKCSRDELAEHIDNAEHTEISPVGLRALGSPRDIYGFSEGMFFVQDEASQICVGVLGAKSGELIVDSCACPGSKSFGAAIDMGNEGRVLSFDLHKNKLSLVESGAERLGITITIIKADVCDGRHYLCELEGSADRVLCDVPCSGFGVIAKKPELRYKDPAESAALPDIQLAILENCSRYLKKGGTLIYSTCTVFDEENENNVQRFLDKHTDFELCPFEYNGVSSKTGTLTLLPHIHGTDGFFIARLTKIN